MPTFSRWRLLAWSVLACSACATSTTTVDGGALDASVLDDGGAADAGAPEEDGGSSDGGVAADAGADDAGAPADGGAGRDGGQDAGGADGGAPDGGVATDGGSIVDGGTLDAGAGSDGGVDAGASDAGTPIDAGAVDAGGTGVDAGNPYSSPARPQCASSYVIPPADQGGLEDMELLETSGLAAALESPGVLFAHNDSGDSARVFVVGAADASDLGQIAFTATTFVDAEDIATAPCPDRSGPCIWIADTGDNTRVRAEVSLFVIPEPAVDAATGIGLAETDPTWRFRFTYAGGPVDVEAMVVAHDASRVYLFEKLDADAVRVFALDAPFDADAVATASVVATFEPPGLSFVSLGRAITAADLHPAGRLAVRVYSGIYEYRFNGSQTIEDIADVAPTLVTLGPLSEPQGEALAYGSAGIDLFSVSESTQQMSGEPLHRFVCQ